MDPFFDDYLDRLADLHNDCKAVVGGLPQDALDWKPGPDMNSIGVLMAHIVGAERYWLGDVVLGEPSGRKREQEFLTSGVSSEALFDRMDASLAYFQVSLDTLSLQAVHELRLSPMHGEEHSIGWALLHILRHTALHLGHIEDAVHGWNMRPTPTRDR